GWIIQFIGHYYEGRKPAFIDDVTGLIIGPLFVIAELAFLMGLRKPLQYAIEERSGPVGRNTRKAAM
ncbi:putative membrane protein, partial [Pseudomonas amygdali pv. eriobotryae]